MAYFRGILSGLTAIIFADLVLALWLLFKFAGNSKATSLAAIAGLLLEALFSPVFWVLAIALFALFFAASRSRNEAVRLVFFWFPTLTTSCAGILMAASFAWLSLLFRKL